MQYLNFQTACSQAYSQNKSQQTIQHRLNKQESALKSKIDDLLAEGDENSGRDCLNIQKYEQANNVTIQNNIDLLDNSDDECSQQSLKLEEGKQRFETQPDIDQSLSSISNTFCSPKVNTFDGQNMQLLSFDKRGLQNSSESHCKNGMASLKLVSQFKSSVDQSFNIDLQSSEGTGRILLLQKKKKFASLPLQESIDFEKVEKRILDFLQVEGISREQPSLLISKYNQNLQQKRFSVLQFQPLKSNSLLLKRKFQSTFQLQKESRITIRNCESMEEKQKQRKDSDSCDKLKQQNKNSLLSSS